MLYDHIDLRVSDLANARPLYDALLPAMGCSQVSEDAESVCYYRAGEERSAAFLGLLVDPSHRPGATRIAFRAASRAELDHLAHVARTAGAKVFEPPHLCEEYMPLYYATFFEDAEGNKLEICYRETPQ